MYRVEVSGVPNGSEWDIQPSAFLTYDLSFQFALGIGKTILAMSGGNIRPTMISLYLLLDQTATL